MIGNLNDRITIQTPVRTQDGAGGFTATWQEVKTVFAEVKNVRGSRFIQLSQIREGRPFEILIRKPVDYEIKPGDRIIYKSKTLAFHAVFEAKKDSDYSTILAFEVV